MTDITKCPGSYCQMKEKCFRYTASDDYEGQSYFAKIPLKDGKCDMFYGEKAGRIINQLKDITNGKG